MAHNTDSTKNTVAWNKVNWRKIQKTAFKLQKRIYKASSHGDIRKVRRLQRLMMRSWSNKMLAVRRVTQENQGKKTAGVDGIKELSPEERMNLVGHLKLTGKSKPTLRVWIPKPGRDEKRPLGIPTMYDRASQALIKAAIEPEWEARFEKNSYGFRPGRSGHDAIKAIKLSIQTKAKYVLDADISKCFDKIDHQKLLHKAGYKGLVRKQIKAWLKSGVIDFKTFKKTEEGTPQGGVASPLLANIALHGIETTINDFAKTLKMRDKNGSLISLRDRISSLNFIRYADDFILMHQEKQVVIKGKAIISEWLKEVGLELKPSKTRITHTLLPNESEDNIAGFNFLGFNIRQYDAGRHCSAKNGHGEILGFKTLIIPTLESTKRVQRNIKSVIRRHRSSPQESLINHINPIIIGWGNYYKHSDIKTMGHTSRFDHNINLKLKSWAIRNCKNSWSKGYSKYWHQDTSNYVSNGKMKKRNRIIFSTRKGVKIAKIDDIECSSTKYVKIQGNRSPFDGDLKYWSKRKAAHPELNSTKSKLLSKQKGRCRFCGLYFKEEELLETDHVRATMNGGKDEYKNLQLLHKHCHDNKTAIDYKINRLIRKGNSYENSVTELNLKHCSVIDNTTIRKITKKRLAKDVKKLRSNKIEPS